MKLFIYSIQDNSSPAMLGDKRKRSASRQPVRKKKRTAPRNSSSAIFELAGQLGSIAKTFEPTSGGLSSPERRRLAIQLLEKDGDLSDNEEVAAIRLFSRNTAVADSFVSITKKATRTAFVQAELLDTSSSQ